MLNLELGPSAFILGGVRPPSAAGGNTDASPSSEFAAPATPRGRSLLAWPGKSLPPARAVSPPRLIGTLDPVDADANQRQWLNWPASWPTSGLLLLGDNADALQSLRQTGFESRIDLIYVDPPFDTSDVFVERIQLRGELGDLVLGSKPLTVGRLMQYRDTWKDDDYLQFIYERLVAMMPLMKPTGSIYVHCDYRRSHHIRVLMDEVFGEENFRNEIIWFYPRGGDGERAFNRKHDTLLFYSNGDRWTFNADEVRIPYTAEQLARFAESDEMGRYYWNVNPRGERVKTYLRKSGIGEYDVWNIGIDAVQIQEIGYPTQKPERLIERVIRASSSPGDIVLDCFVGSGTTPTVAQRLGRRWIACDNSIGAVRTTTKRVGREVLTQIRSHAGAQLTLDAGSDLRPAQLGFSVFSLNSDLALAPDVPLLGDSAVASSGLKAKLRVEADGDQLRIEIREFSSDSVERALRQVGANVATLPWRALVDSIEIDHGHDDRDVFRTRLADFPMKRRDVVRGEYIVPNTKLPVAVRIWDILGNSVTAVLGP